jgi:UDP-N-acetylglucosamine/UDP-N-acetylgalactosamine diphosphorylase
MDLTGTLKQFGQEHLLSLGGGWSVAEFAACAADLESVDFAHLASLYEWHHAPPPILPALAYAVDPPCRPLSHCGQELIAAGEDLLRQGKVGVVLVAGGCGTRLGFSRPKGMFPIDPVSGTTPFQVYFGKVAALSQRYRHRIPYCIMTSAVTDRETAAYLKQHDYFGVPEEDVFLFRQDVMPVLSLDHGRILPECRGKIVQSPKGHGDMLYAITTPREGISTLERLRERNVEYLFYHQINNVLAPIGSPELLGCHVANRSEMTTLVLRKQSANDRQGTAFSSGGRCFVAEYSEIPQAVAERKKQDGTLHLSLGNLAVHVFNVKFLERMAQNKPLLPFHTVRKKRSFLDLETGAIRRPTAENVLQFERFIFDLKPFAQNATFVEADPTAHYASLKNTSGVHSLETVRERFQQTKKRETCHA